MKTILNVLGHVVATYLFYTCCMCVLTFSGSFASVITFALCASILCLLLKYLSRLDNIQFETKEEIVKHFDYVCHLKRWHVAILLCLSWVCIIAGGYLNYARTLVYDSIYPNAVQSLSDVWHISDVTKTMIDIAPNYVNEPIYITAQSVYNCMSLEEDDQINAQMDQMDMLITAVKSKACIDAIPVFLYAVLACVLSDTSKYHRHCKKLKKELICT